MWCLLQHKCGVYYQEMYLVSTWSMYLALGNSFKVMVLNDIWAQQMGNTKLLQVFIQDHIFPTQVIF